MITVTITVKITVTIVVVTMDNGNNNISKTVVISKQSIYKFISKSRIGQDR